MSIPGSSSALFLAAAAGGGGGYQVERSLRFNSSDSAYLSRTPSSAGNRRTWTLSLWVKRANLGAQQKLLSVNTASDNNNAFNIDFDSSDRFSITASSGGADILTLTTTQVFRDVSAWYHILLSADTTQSTASNRLKLYVNGQQVTVFTTASYPAQNTDLRVNNNEVHYIGRLGYTSVYCNAYLADIHLIDGSALDPSSFTEVSATTGQLIPKKYTGTFGTNGFWLQFADNSNNTATTLGKDTSGNGNNWTPNNLSVTAGAGNDSLVDVPTNGAQTDTGVGGEVRGNYATLNPLVTNSTTTLANGNLDATGSEQVTGFSSIVPSSGKWYLEITLGTVGSNSFIGLAGTTPIFGSYCVYGINGFGFANTGWGSPSSTVSGTGAAGDVIGLAFDVDAKTLQFYKNGSSIGTISAFTYPQNWSIGFRCNAAVSTPWVFNFGQRPFAYTAPSGFKALCTANLPAPLVTKPSTVMDVALYTGTGSALTPTSSLGFNPDLVWIKGRSGATDHSLYDSVRGVEKRLESNTTDAEVTSDGGVTAFNTAGFSVGTLAQVNTSSATYAAWAWDAGSSTVTNTQGSITSSVRANPSAGFSVVTFNTGSSGDKTVGHGLNIAPSLILLKSRATVENWSVFHSSVCDSVVKYLILNNTSALLSNAQIWGAALPTSSVFGIRSGTASTANTDMVAYCFAPVAGYSSFGSYTGGGSSYPFVYCGFRPRLILIKDTTTGGTFYDWFMLDTARNPYNFGALNSDSQYTLFANTSGQEQQWLSLDILSNGFRVIDQSATINNSGSTYVWAAWAESPFAYSRAR